jgi:hypothetical protein
MPIFTSGWVNVARVCRKNPGGSPIKSSKSFWLFIADISTKVQDLCVWGVRGRTRRGGHPWTQPVLSRALFSRRWEIWRGGGGHSNQTPSPQAAISINHAHHVRSSIECVTLVEKAWWGGGIPPLSLHVSHISLKVLTRPWVPKHPPTRASHPPAHVSLQSDHEVFIQGPLCIIVRCWPCKN